MTEEERPWFKFKRHEDGGWTLEHRIPKSLSKFETHLRSSRREFLLAWRDLIDRWIEPLEEKEEKEEKEIIDIDIKGE